MIWTPARPCMLCDMMPTGFHAAELAEIEFGESVCVIGIGPVGLMAVRACVLRGAGDIFCVGTRKICMDAAKQVRRDGLSQLQKRRSCRADYGADAGKGA